MGLKGGMRKHVSITSSFRTERDEEFHSLTSFVYNLPQESIFEVHLFELHHLLDLNYFIIIKIISSPEIKTHTHSLLHNH